MKRTRAWLERLRNPDQLGRLLDEHRYREALDQIEDGPEREDQIAAVQEAAVLHWLDQAESACLSGDRRTMNAALAEAARFRNDTMRPHFREVRYRIRRHVLTVTIATHWSELLDRADETRWRDDDLPPSLGLFRNRGLVVGWTARELECAEAERLEACRARLFDAYPSSLHAKVAEGQLEWIRAALLTAAGRPDLGVLSILQCSEGDPLVCLERARIACALDLPRTAMLALADFAIHHGHETIRRLHTGVFMAQMAEAAGYDERAIEILEQVPLDEVGRRPVLLLARLHARNGGLDRAHQLLDAWLTDHPDDDEALALRSGDGG